MSSKFTLQQNIYLIGDVSPQLVGKELPSQLEVLKVFFFHARLLKTPLRQSARNTIKEVKVIWEKANLPTRRDHHCIVKLLKIYSKYRAVQKGKGRDSNRKKEESFVSSLNNLFDISYNNILQKIEAERMKFQLKQKEDRTAEYIADIKPESDSISALKQVRIKKRKNSHGDAIESKSDVGSP